MKGAVGTLNILLIAESENDHLLVQSLLREIRNHDASLEWINRRASIESELRRGVHEVVLLDSRFDNGAGLEILRIIRRDAGLPVIILADVEEHEFDVAATAAGAYDYLVKKHINAPLFERSLRYALGRRKMEAELRAALAENQRFGGAIDNLITGVVITDVTQPDNPIIFVNSTFTRITGYSFEEAIGRNCRFLSGPDTAPETRRAISEALDNKVPFHGQILNYRKDDTPFWNELKLSPLFENGKVRYYVGLIEDVSMRVEAELWRQQLLNDLTERVKELTLLQMVSSMLQDDSVPLEESLATIVRKIPTGFRYPKQIAAKLSFDDQEYFSLDSPGAEYFGAPKSAAEKPDDNKHISLEFPLRLSDNREGCLWVSHRADAPPDAASFLTEERIMLNSIVEMLRSRLEQELARKALEKANEELEMRVRQRTHELELRSQELRDSEERLRRINREVLKLSKLRIPRFVNLETLFRSFTEAAVRSMDIDRASIWLYSDDRTYLRCINAFDEATGKHSGGQITHYSADYPEEYRSIDQERVFASDDVALDKRIANFYEKYLKGSDVRSLLVAPILKAGQVVGVLALSRSHQPRSWLLEDKTYAGSLADLVALELEAVEHRKMEESLRIASREAEEARRSAEAANRAKSEFLSRMSHELRTPLNSILGFGQLLQRDQITDKQRGRVDLIVTAGKHLLALINEVLDLSRVESGNISLSLEPVRLNEVIEETLSLISPLAARYHVTVHNSPASEDRFILADRQKVQQVLLNLLSNAVKYNHENGTVRVWCEEVSAERLQISVANSGRGIAPADLQRAFQPFERLMAEGSGIEGTGLGLALARKLVEAMGGVIEAESTPGVETVFSVTLPAAAPQTSSAGLSETAVRHRMALGEICVLYIEDNLTNLKLIESILAEQANIRLLTAMQGGLGLELAREHHPDVILLDLHLPDLEGDEVLRRLKASQATESIPVVVLSADATSRQIRHLRDLGAFDYLTKPVDIEQFLESIGRAVAR